MRPHNTIENLLVHPKDKREAKQKTLAVKDVKIVHRGDRKSIWH